MTFPEIELDEDPEDEVDPMRDWRRLRATRKVRDELIRQRDNLLTDLMKAAMGATDPKVRGIGERLVQLDEVIQTMGGDSLSKEMRNAQRVSDSRE